MKETKSLLRINITLAEKFEKAALRERRREMIAQICLRALTVVFFWTTYLCCYFYETSSNAFIPAFLTTVWTLGAIGKSDTEMKGGAISAEIFEQNYRDSIDAIDKIQKEMERETD